MNKDHEEDTKLIVQYSTTIPVNSMRLYHFNNVTYILVLTHAYTNIHKKKGGIM